MAFANETQTVSPSTPEIIGADAIRAALATMPASPGVYQMIGASGTILYVGKAKQLKNRVSNYTSINQLTTRIMKMVEQVVRVEIITCRSEAEALLIEANLIRRHKPRYNILLKDDKSFPHLFISGDHAFPRIAKHRGARSKKGEYFGPFASVGALNETLVLLQKIFQLRPCEDTVFKGRTRPCLQYQIKRCSAPCVGYVSEADYGAQLSAARDFLRGRHRDVQDALLADMKTASAAQDYETAALLRDRIQALTRVQQEQAMHPGNLRDADILIMARRGARSVVQLYLYREGTPLGHQSFYPKHDAEAPDAEVMASFMAQLYQSHLPAPELLVNVLPAEPELLAEALALHAGHAISISQPQRGDKRTLIEQGQQHAEAALAREEQQRASVLQSLTQVQALFGLKQPIQRIEVYDNSHLGGTSALGAMIVATPDGFDKRSYRTFTMNDMPAGDDYAMMRAMFARRFKRAGEGWALPDLVLIDGGKGQLSAVEAALKEIGVEGLNLVAIAKGEERNAGREWFFRPQLTPFQLPEHDPALHYLQRLRDEAHRFAIGSHRNKRLKALTGSALDDIPGIGTTRKRALLHHFGSRAAVERATLEELHKVEGISKTTARKIYDYFNH